MRRVALYGVGWLMAAAVAVLLAWQGVERVGANVTNRHPRALTADEARAALAAGEGDTGGDAAPDGSAATPPTSASAPGRNTTTSTARRPGSTVTTTTTSRPAGTAPPTSPAPTSPATTQPPAATPTTTASGVVKTYNLVGGSVTLRFDTSSGKVTVVWANPNPGYRAEVDDRSDGGVRVRFDGTSHRSELEAWWDGQPRDKVTESGDSGDGRSGRG